MHQLKAALALLVLAACVPGSPSALLMPYRTTSAPIWSNAQLDPARLVGSWQQAAAFAAAPGGCAPGGVQIGGQPGALTLAAKLCLSGQEQRLSGPLLATGPGRFRAGGPNAGGQDWWVIWVDADYRTLAIGTPSGAFGFILNRGGALPPDRFRAAREIFDFNGYDTRRLMAF
ncbi:MAG: lipocalin family protein [Rhodobacteraceae bacterium]|nr:lipocalin family protein [Paracoccaceae bacterium]